MNIPDPTMLLLNRAYLHALATQRFTHGTTRKRREEQKREGAQTVRSVFLLKAIWRLSQRYCSNL